MTAGTEVSRTPKGRTPQGKLKECAQYILDYEAARGEVPAVTVLENAVALAQFVVTHIDGFADHSEPETTNND